MNKKQTNILFIFMAVIAIVILIGTGAYAYYRTTISGTTSGTIARWSFMANNQVSTFNLSAGGLYPGKSAVEYIELSAENSDLPIVFAVIMNFPNYLNSDGNFDNEIDTLKFASLYGKTYFDNAYTHNFINDQIVGYFGYLVGGSKVTVPIYYNWPYDNDENGFVLDTDVQNIADGRLLTNNISVVGYQMDISTSYNSIASWESFLVEINNQCSTDAYSYSNKFGYPCNDFILIPDTNLNITTDHRVNLEYGDGTIDQVSEYLVTGLKARPETTE